MMKGAPLFIVTCVLATLVVAGCRTPESHFGADTISRIDKRDGGTPLYMAMGKLDFDGENPQKKVEAVIFAACPAGSPTLLGTSATRLPSETSNTSIWMAMFSCNQPIPGVD